MRKILGTRDQYYDQTNNALAKYAEDYHDITKYISCGPESAAMGFDIAGWDMEKYFTKGVQPGDSIAMCMFNPFNQKYFGKDARKRPNEWASNYPSMSKIIFEKQACSISWSLSFDIITLAIKQECPVMVCGNFPCGGHYVLVVGFDTEKRTLIINDPYRYQWKDEIGYNRELKWKYLKSILYGFHINFSKKDFEE